MKQHTFLRYFRVPVPMNGKNVVSIEHNPNERVVPMNLEYVNADVGLVVCGLIVTEPQR